MRGYSVMIAVMASPTDALFIWLVKTIYFSLSYCKPGVCSSRPIVRFHRVTAPEGIDRMWDGVIPRAVSGETRTGPRLPGNRTKAGTFKDQVAGTAFCLALNMVDIARPSQAKKKRIRRILYAT